MQPEPAHKRVHRGLKAQSAASAAAMAANAGVRCLSFDML